MKIEAQPRLIGQGVDKNYKLSLAEKNKAKLKLPIEKVISFCYRLFTYSATKI